MMQKIIFKTPIGVPSALVIISILVLTLAPFEIDANSVGLFPGSDKIAHIVMFFILCVIVILDCSRKVYPHYLKFDIYAAIVVACSFLGGFIEFLQYSMKIGRSMELLDFLSDTLGAILGFLFCYYFFIGVFRRAYKNYTPRRK